MVSNWSCRTLSHATPIGRGMVFRVSINSASVATKSSGESWDSMTTTSSGTSWIECTVVAIGVAAVTMPSSRKMPVSRSAKPAPLPVRPPARPTATEPTTQKSSGSTSSNSTRPPCSMKPCGVAASSNDIPLAASIPGSRRR